MILKISILNIPDISFWMSLFVRKSIRGKLKDLPEPVTQSRCNWISLPARGNDEIAETVVLVSTRDDATMVRLGFPWSFSLWLG